MALDVISAVSPSVTQPKEVGVAPPVNKEAEIHFY